MRGRSEDPIVVTGLDLTLDEVLRVAREGAHVSLDPSALGRMRAARDVVERAIDRGDPVYGLNTGVGVNRRVRVDPAEAAAAGAELLREHRVAQGTLAPPDVVRATMLVLANGFARGTAGVTTDLAERLVRAINARDEPRMRTLGSVGVADLAPLADLASEVFADHALAPGEALALLDNNAFGTASAALALADARILADTMDLAGALGLEAFAGNLQHLHERVGSSRPYPGLERSLARMRELLEGSSGWEAGAARNLQDPISFRSLPHVNGALHDALDFAVGQLGIELNSSQGNPIVVAEERRLVSVGNFDIAPIAQALDLVRVSLASAVAMSCERSLKLLDTAWSGLPTGLASGERPESLGIGMLGIAAQSLAVEARTLAQPVSHELVSTTEAEGIEDRTTMAPLGARRLSDQVGLARRVVAIELAVAARALSLRPPARMGGGTSEALSVVLAGLPWITGPGANAPDVEPLLEAIAGGSFAAKLYPRSARRASRASGSRTR
jgi:histidine ammonia-lyase